MTLALDFVTGSTINEHLATILVGLVQLVSNIAALFVVDRSGRKPLLMISAIIMCIAMSGMGTAFYLKQQGSESLGYVSPKQKNALSKNYKKNLTFYSH